MNEQKITFDKVMRWTAVGGITVAVFAITNYLSSSAAALLHRVVLAYLLYPMVKFIQYRMHVKVRALAIIIAMLAILSVIDCLSTSSCRRW